MSDRFHFLAGNGTPVLIIPADGRGLMLLPDDKSVPMVYITPDGRAELRDDYDADVAARAFWQAVAAVAPFRRPSGEVMAAHARTLSTMLDAGWGLAMSPGERDAIREAIRIFGGEP